MKNRFKLLLILFISILCINVKADEKIKVLVGNQWLTEENRSINDGNGGRAILDVDNNELDLIGFNYTGKGEYCEYDGEFDFTEFYSSLYATGDLTINLLGTNTFNYTAPGVMDGLSLQFFAFFGGNVTIKGPGTLNLLSSGNGDPSSYAIGITGPGSVTINNANLNIKFAYGDYIYGIYAYGNVNFISSVVDFDYIGNNGASFDGVIAIDSQFTAKNSNIIMKATSTVTEDNRGIESDTVLIANCKVSMNFGSASSGGSGAFYSDHVEIHESMLTLYTDNVAFFTEDSLVLNTSILLIKAQGGVLMYDDDGPTGSVYLGFSSVKASPDYYLTTPASDFGDTDLKELKNMQYFATTVETKSSEVNYSLNNPGISILTPNLVEKIDLTELDNMNRNFGQDLYIELHTSDNYKKVDDEIINNNLGNYQIGKVMDISLTKQIGLSGEYAYITELNNKVQISIDLDDSLIKDGRKYQVMNVHNGEAKKYNATFDKSTGKLTFETGQFSTFAIIYSDEVNPQTGDNICYFITLMILSIMGIVIGFKLERRY